MNKKKKAFVVLPKNVVDADSYCYDNCSTYVFGVFTHYTTSDVPFKSLY